MYYLHGAIHLWQDDRGNNGKWLTGSAKTESLCRLEVAPPPRLQWW
jgi:hypothetical protein